MPRQLLPFFTCLLLFAGCGERAAPQHGDATADRAGAPDSPPNILLIVVDDMGFTDLGAFGGEIATPNLDALANAGVRFANFHASTMCAPSRAMLLTGVDAHLSGFGNMLEELSPNQKGQPGYEGFLNERVVTVSELLQDAGYRTYVSGKWHLGTEEIARPSARGFDRSFVLASGGASHFADMRPAYAPSPEIRANYWDGDAKLDALPADFEYSSQYYVDRLIADMTADAGADSAQPFFAYLAFTAPHWPIQAPDDAIERHCGRYDDGFDAVAERRLGRLKELGFVAENATRSARSPKEKPFGELDTETRAIEIRAMEIYAAMIDEVDRHTGRLVEFLDDRGLLKNTVVVFLSDNGPEATTWTRPGRPTCFRPFAARSTKATISASNGWAARVRTRCSGRTGPTRPRPRSTCTRDSPPKAAPVCRRSFAGRAPRLRPAFATASRQYSTSRRRCSISPASNTRAAATRAATSSR